MQIRIIDPLGYGSEWDAHTFRELIAGETIIIRPTSKVFAGSPVAVVSEPSGGATVIANDDASGADITCSVAGAYTLSLTFADSSTRLLQLVAFEADALTRLPASLDATKKRNVLRSLISNHIARDGLASSLVNVHLSAHGA